MSLETTAKDWLSDPAWNRVRDIDVAVFPSKHNNC